MLYTKEEIYNAIESVYDPEVGFNLVEMGLIYDVICNENMEITITMTLSTKACPLHQMILTWVEDAIFKNLDKVNKVVINLVWEPVWNINMANDHVREALRGF